MHNEENDLLGELSNTNTALERLKQRMHLLQGNVRTYTERIKKISEKKRKLIEKMSSTVNQSLQSATNDIAVSKEIARPWNTTSQSTTPVSSSSTAIVITSQPTKSRQVEVVNDGKDSNNPTIDSKSGDDYL